MSLWHCRDCGGLTGGSDGWPQCITCNSLNVERVTGWADDEWPEPTATITITDNAEAFWAFDMDTMEWYAWSTT